MKKNKPSFAKASEGQGKQNNRIEKYQPSQIEKKWQKYWEEKGLYKFRFDPSTSSGQVSQKDKYYTLVELPYPSGDLHIGHWFAFVAPDVLSRFKTMKGKQVFFPMGYDAFGLPAENAAIKRGIHPQDWTLSNIKTMTEQFKSMGTMIDWASTTITCLPEYYKWNQWIFLKMFEKGIAYRSATLSNWCEKDQTVLANEHVENGKCWRCREIVVQKEVEQWFLRITEYADRLLWKENSPHPSPLPQWGEGNQRNLYNGVDWPKSVRDGQNNWIGRSEGAEIEFRIQNSELRIKVFTTRPDTLYGATFLVVAPEHPIVAKLLNSEFKIQSSELEKVKDYVEKASKKTELERKENKEKTGVFSGLYAINPVANSEQIPIWIADYVLSGYGTGAIMAVPAHDERDFEFAKKFELPVKEVIIRPGEASGEVIEESSRHSSNKKLNLPYVGEGKIINSGEWDGWETPESMNKVISWLEKKGLATPSQQYHLHDWSVSRQRYWGTPVPMVHCQNCADNGDSWFTTEEAKKMWKVEDRRSKLEEKNQSSSFNSQNPSSMLHDLASNMKGIYPVPYDNLPVELPYDVDYTPKGKPPLASNEKWLQVKCPKCGKDAKRDAETLDTFFDSSWYYYRYLSPHLKEAAFDKDRVKNMMPLDIYFGGAEHTLGHTLYARFFTKFFFDLGLIDFEEFALKRIQHGIVLGPDGNKMSKSRGNVINPDDVVKEYGADAVRLYLSFMMPYEATGPWSTTAMGGVYRFLRRIWELFDKVEISNFQIPNSSQKEERNQMESGKSKLENLSPKDLYEMHRTIKKVTEEVEAIKFNTAVAAIMEWLNYLSAKTQKETSDNLPVTIDNPSAVGQLSKVEYKTLLLLLAPFAPHITEELWQKIDHQIGNAKKTADSGQEYVSIHSHSFPEFDKKYLTQEEVTVVVQINGKRRAEIRISKDIISDQKQVQEIAQTASLKYLDGNEIRKVIYIPGKIVNFVV